MPTLEIQVPPLLPKPGGLEALLSAAQNEAQGVVDPTRHLRSRSLRDAIEGAEAYVGWCASMQSELADATAGVDEDFANRWVNDVVRAWPNARSRALMGYAAQLAEEIVQRAPCRYALRRALGTLRRASDPLPSIAKVLAAVHAAQAQIHDATSVMAWLPPAIDRARVVLADMESQDGTKSSHR